MLQLQNVTKVYEAGTSRVQALGGVSLRFRKSEFVSILGPSGCGKTTLLNIIGGLDQYTSGDLLIEGKSTKRFFDRDWDAYRNSTVGFIFQSYNLISHLSILDNVAVALTLSGVSAQTRKEKAAAALESVGLGEQLHKKPSQLSGGQMQRVAIARALVNDPKILMADEPTGALDSATSVQIMELLKTVARDRLVIMVTHNQELAKEYSDRIIRLKDGMVVDDTNPCTEAEREGNESMVEGEKLVTQKTAMSWGAAIKLSFQNLMTKKKRTIMTAIAGSIGIIGVALVLAISSGMTTYVNSMQSDALAGFPISIAKTVTVSLGGAGGAFGGNSGGDEFPPDDTIYAYDPSAGQRVTHVNILTEEFTEYLNSMDKSLYNAISYSYDLEMAVLAKNGESYQQIHTSGTQSLFGSSSYFNEIPNSEDFIQTQYDVLDGKYPTEAGELALIVDSRNRINVEVLKGLNITVTEQYSFSDMLNREFRVVGNNDYYTASPTENGVVYSPSTDYATMYDRGFPLQIVGIMRVKESASSELLSSGIGYTTALTQAMLADAQESEIVLAQRAAGDSYNVLTGGSFNEYETYESVLRRIGADTIATSAQIYPVHFEAKEAVKAYLDAYNEGRPQDEQILYTDLAETLSGMITTMIDTIALVLMAFAMISLVVSTIMIGIITYVSVVERTKEIGILRAIGARKKDVTRIFNAETLIIGFAAGILGIVVTLLLSIPINILILSLTGVSGIARLPVLQGLLLILGSMALTLVGGLIPALGAAKKDPVAALRNE